MQLSGNNRVVAGALPPLQRTEEMRANNPARWFLSTAAATSSERLAAIAVVGVALLAFVVTIPYVRVPLANVPAFVPAYQAALCIIDLTTAVLLIGQFARLRSLSLLALGAGYLFDAAMIVPHTLSFPGLFAPTGLLGAGEQTTAWLYVFWHGGFSAFALAYVYFRNRGTVIGPDARFRYLWTTIVAVVVAATALTVLTTLGHDLLPRVMQGGDYSMLVSKGVSPFIWFLTLAAAITVWRQANSVLDLWLGVVMVVWLFDIALAAVLGSSRFDLGFYAGRLYGLIAASIVLVALLVETVRLYGRLAEALDLAETRNAELIGAHATMAAAQRMEAFGQLTNGIAHDFSNLLTVVGGNLDMIRKDPTDVARVERLVGNAGAAVRRASRLTRQLMMFGGRQALRPVSIDVTRLIQDFIPVLQRSAEGTELMAGLSPNVHPTFIDAAQFETALVNLIANARDATGGGGRVIIETRNVALTATQFGKAADVVPGDYVLVAVRDTGPGMPPEVAARAVEPFFTTKEPGRGSGLGLSQVYGFVKSTGGLLRIETQPGRGTSVNLYFPKAAGREDGSAQPVPASSAPSPEGMTVLVVEDDADVREVTVAAVGELGYAVREAGNAQEALTLLHTDTAVDLLFSDILLPGDMSGVDLAVEARRIRPALKVLLTSGNPGAIAARGTVAQRSFVILEKPYIHSELADKIRVVMTTS
jgi:signal transduction histidine kinase/CheY-like chemotaxis protein